MNMKWILKISIFGLSCLVFSVILYTRTFRLVEQSSVASSKQLWPKDQTAKVFIWWTPFITGKNLVKSCDSIQCVFTEDRSYFNSANLKGIIFYGSNFNRTDLPLPRQSHVPWILFHEESPKNEPMLSYDRVLRLFNMTATFSRHSDFPLTLQYLSGAKQLQDLKYYLPVSQKNKLQIDDQLASVLYVQSICDTMSGRDDYVQELMKFINVDAYGSCLNNKPMPDNLTGVEYLSTIDSDEFYKFVARYKFVIAYENSVCDDYITEKLWRPLIVGVVPIYFGAPNVKMWLPNSKSAIIISDFDSPRHLAEHLMYLNEDDAEYNTYLDHKLKPGGDNSSITNYKLLNALNERQYSTKHIIDAFQCNVCSSSSFMTSKIANNLHYDCGKTPAFPKMDEAIGVASQTPSNYNLWEHRLIQARCDAYLVNWFVAKNRSFTNDEYYTELLNRYDNGVCES